MINLDNLTADEHQVLTAFRKLGEVERLIFITGVRVLLAKRITADQFEIWVSDRLNRQRAGEALTVFDLQVSGSTPVV